MPAMALSSVRLLLDLLFPPRCVGCASVGAPICAACLAAVCAPDEPLCARCGRPLPRSAGVVSASAARSCTACASGHAPVALTALRAAAVYDGVVRGAVLALKYRGQRRLAEPLGDLLATAARQAFPAAELTVPIPLHAARHRQRGYNQAELLARRCASRLRIPSDARILTRHRATMPQVGLSAADRRANVAGAFALASPAVAARLAGKRILLVHDVSTTGSTLDAAASALLVAQPAAIYGIAVTRPNLDDDAHMAAIGIRAAARSSRGR